MVVRFFQGLDESQRSGGSRKERVMGLFRSNTERLLSEYPWMWAVRSRWCRSDNIVVDRLSASSLVSALAEPASDGTECWARFVELNETSVFASIRKIKLDSRLSLGENIVQYAQPDLSLPLRISHLVWQQSNGPYIILPSSRERDLYWLSRDVCIMKRCVIRF